MTGRCVIVVATLAALVAAGVALREAPMRGLPGLSAPVERALDERPAPRRPRAVPPDARAGAIASLRGTQADGAVRVDANGRLVLDVALRRFMDYFLSAHGERDLAALRAAMLAASGLDAAGRAQFAALVDRYLAYAQDASGVDADDPQRGLRERRRRHFGDRDAAALFGDIEQAEQAIARRRDDPGIEVETALRPSEAWRQLDVDETLRASLTPARRHDERVAQLGAAAAARLDALDVAEHDWDRRVAQLRARLGDTRGAARQAALAAALAEGYTQAERRRLLALLAESVP